MRNMACLLGRRTHKTVLSRCLATVAIPPMKEYKYEITSLQNGIKILTEEPIIPSYITIAFTLSIGSQNEDSTTQGASFVISNLIEMNLRA